VPLRVGQGRDRLVTDRLEEVRQRGERQDRLSLGRATGEGQVAPLARQPDGIAPDGGLSDAGLAVDDERRQARRPVVEQALDGRPFGISADHG
jgi:hypothetical protein